MNLFSTKSHKSSEKEDNSPSQDDKRKENALAKSRAKLNDSIRKVEERCRELIPIIDERIYPGEEGKKLLNKIVE